MVIALVVVVVVLLLGAALISSSVTTSTHSSQEYGRSGALAAANAGLAAAVHRLSSQAEETTAQLGECFTTKFEALKSGACEASPSESLSNGASFVYYVYPAMTESENHCTGLWLLAPTGKTISQRCITAIGTAADGVQARVQERVADIKSSLFPVDGLFSYGDILFTESVSLAGEVEALGSVKINKTITNVNSETVKFKYGNGQKLELRGNPECTATCTGQELTKAEQESFGTVEQESKPYKEAEELAVKSGVDKKITITSGEINSKYEMTPNNTATVVIPEGTYYLCKFTSSAVTIEFTPPVKIYLDSSYRTGSTCTAKGTFTANNSITWVDKAATKTASDFKLFAWGNPSEKPPSESNTGIVSNAGASSILYGEIYAPNSYVKITEQTKIHGSVVAGVFNSSHNTEFVAELGSGDGTLNGKAFYAAAYHQCAPKYSKSSPGEGCY